MLVREWMSPDPTTVGVQTAVGEVRTLLNRYGVRHLPVVDRAGNVVGMVSDRDVRLDWNILHRASDREVLSLVRGSADVADIMSSPAHVIGPGASVADAARVMLSRRISALPVVDDDGALVGVITSTDCLLALLSPQGPAGGDGSSHSAVSR